MTDSAPAPTTSSPRADAPIKALIWDLDGILVDSEPLLFEAERLMLAEHGADLTPELKAPFIGRGGLDVVQGLADLFGITEDPQTLMDAKIGHYLELVRTVPGYQPTAELARAVHADGIPQAIASGSTAQAIDLALAGIGLSDMFEIRVSSHEVPRGKPAPDVFLLAAQRLGVPPAQCLVIEDSAPGVQAAHAAGMRCVAIPYVTEPLDPAYGTADHLLAGGMSTARGADLIAWVRERY